MNALTVSLVMLGATSVLATSCASPHCNSTCESGASMISYLSIGPSAFSNASVMFCWNTFCESDTFGVVPGAGADLQFPDSPQAGGALDVTVAPSDMASDMGTRLEVQWFDDAVADGDFYSLTISGSAGTLFQGSAAATYLLLDACGPGGACKEAALNL